MNAINLTGRAAIVTGAAGGLGKGYALALAERGAAVVVNDLGGDTRGQGSGSDLAEAVAAEIRQLGGMAVANCDSVATKAGGDAITACALDAFGRIDIVVNNAGNQRNALFEDLTEDDIESVLAVHLKGAFFVTQPAYRLMKQQGYGRIVFTSSQSGVFGSPYRANYGAAKTGMLGLTRVLVQEAPSGVCINSVMPNASGSRMGTPGEDRVDKDFIAEILSRGNKYAEQATPDYTAALVAYLCSESCKVTGQTFSVLRGNFSRVFTGLSEGWSGPRGHCPAPEDIAANLTAISDISRWDEPGSGIGEVDLVLARLDRRFERDDTV